MHDSIAPDAEIHFPEGLPITCADCGTAHGIGKAVVTDHGLNVVVSREVMAAHESHKCSPAQPTRGDI